MVRCRSARDKPFFAISPRFRAQALPPRPFPFATSDRAARCRGAAPVRSSDAHRRSCWRALDARSRTPRRATACQAQRSICRAVSPTVTGRVAPATSRRQCPVTCMTTAVTADVIGLSAIHWPITAAATSSTAAGAAHDRNPCHRILLLPTHCQELIPPAVRPVGLQHECQRLLSERPDNAAKASSDMSTPCFLAARRRASMRPGSSGWAFLPDDNRSCVRPRQ